MRYERNWVKNQYKKWWLCEYGH